MIMEKKDVRTLAELQEAPALTMSKSKMDKMVQDIFDAKAEKDKNGKVREVMIDLADTITMTEGIKGTGAIDVRFDIINKEHIDTFYGIYRECDNPNLPAIWVEYQVDAKGNVHFIVHDGRHRRLGALKAGKKQIRAVVFCNLNDVERRILGLYGNIRVGLKLGLNDLSMNVLEFMKKGIKKPEIRIIMSGTPKFDLARAIKWGSRNYNLSQLNLAIDEVAKGNKTLRQAADEFEVSFKRLQKATSTSKRGSSGKKRADDPTKVAGHIAQEFKRFSDNLDERAATLIQQSRMNAIPTESAAGIFKKMFGHINGLTERVKAHEGHLRSIQFGEEGQA